MPRPPELERDVQFWIRVYTRGRHRRRGSCTIERNLGGRLRDAALRPRHRRRVSASALVDDERDTTPRRCGASPQAATPRSSAEDQRIKRAVGRRRHAGTPACRDRGHPLPARPVRPLPRGAGALGRLGDAHRRDVREPGAAGRARRAAARGVLVQPGRLFQGGRGGPVAVHALHRAALHAHRQRGGRPPRSVPLHRSGRAAAGLQLPRCSAPGRSRSPPTTTAPPACAARRNRMGTDDIVKIVRGYKSPYLRLRLAQFLCLVPRRARDRPQPREVLRLAAARRARRASAKCRCRPTSR